MTENVHEYVQLGMHSNDIMVNEKAVTGNRYTEYVGERYNEKTIICNVNTT
jgi:hypothetical protein